jgi:uncharacterized membrane protein
MQQLLIGLFQARMAMIWLRVSFAGAIAIAMATRGYRHRSLSKSGAIGALLVGFLCMLASIRFGMALLVFFVSSSMLTKVIHTHIIGRIQ